MQMKSSHLNNIHNSAIVPWKVLYKFQYSPYDKTYDKSNVDRGNNCNHT